MKTELEDRYKTEFDNKYKHDLWGKHSRLFYKKKSIESLGLEYKKGHAIKVLTGQGDVRKMAIIMKYYEMKGLSPEIYNTGEIDGYPYLEVAYTKDDSIKDKIVNEAGDFITPYEIDLIYKDNYRGNKFVDYHAFELDEEKFETWLKKEIAERTHWGKLNEKGERYSYQEEKRNQNQRIRQMQLNKIDFEGKKVLDLGCNLGLMSYYAADRGAEVTAVDKSDIIEIAEINRLYMGFPKVNFAVDYEGKFDIVFYFAMVHLLGYPHQFKGTNLIFEGHNLQDRVKTQSELSRTFNVEFKGYTTDRGKRPVFWCT